MADIIVSNMNGDSRNDLMASSAHRYGIWWSEQGEIKNGSPEFTQHDLIPKRVSESHALIAEDINGDGLKDLITGKWSWSHGRSEAGSDKPAFLYRFEAGKDDLGKASFTPRDIEDRIGIGTRFAVLGPDGDGLLDVVTAYKIGVLPFE